MKKEVEEDDLLILFLDDPFNEDSDNVYDIPDELVARYEKARSDLRMCLDEIRQIINSEYIQC